MRLSCWKESLREDPWEQLRSYILRGPMIWLEKVPAGRSMGANKVVDFPRARFIIKEKPLREDPKEQHRSYIFQGSIFWLEKTLREDPWEHSQIVDCPWRDFPIGNLREDPCDQQRSYIFRGPISRLERNPAWRTLGNNIGRAF